MLQLQTMFANSKISCNMKMIGEQKEPKEEKEILKIKAWDAFFVQKPLQYQGKLIKRKVNSKKKMKNKNTSDQVPYTPKFKSVIWIFYIFLMM